MKHASVTYNKNQIACKYIKPWNAYQITNHQLRKLSFQVFISSSITLVLVRFHTITKVNLSHFKNVTGKNIDRANCKNIHPCPWDHYKIHHVIALQLLDGRLTVKRCHKSILRQQSTSPLRVKNPFLSGTKLNWLGLEEDRIIQLSSDCWN